MDDVFLPNKDTGTGNVMVYNFATISICTKHHCMQNNMFFALHCLSEGFYDEKNQSIIKAQTINTSNILFTVKFT